MTIRDISLKKRLLLGNMLMVAIPLALLSFFAWLFYEGAHSVGIEHDRDFLMLLFPERGRALSVQYSVGALQETLEKPTRLKEKNVKKDCAVLEAQGIKVLVKEDDDLVYVSAGTGAKDISAETTKRCGDAPSHFSWNDNGFAFRYTSNNGRRIIEAVGNLPFSYLKNRSEFDIHSVVQLALYLALFLVGAFAVALGFYLSRLLSRQILEPLKKLRLAAAELEHGNYDAPLIVNDRDELGDTCRSFDNMRQELKEAREEHKRYDDSQRELIAGISHDLATPIAAIKGYASGILDGIADTPAKRRRYLTQIAKTTETMERLTADLLLVSKLDMGRVEFNLEKVCLTKYFSDFSAECAELLAARGLILHLDEDSEHAIALLDREQFARVVDNLLENSIKYKQNDVVNVTISVLRDGDKLRVSFADDGRGVDESEREKIFQSFYRTDRARTNTQKGSGLGLAVVSRIVINLNGRVWAEETSGGGLTVVIELPALNEDDCDEHE